MSKSNVRPHITLFYLPIYDRLPDHTLEGSQLAQPDAPNLAHPNYHTLIPYLDLSHNIAPTLHLLHQKSRFHLGVIFGRDPIILVGFHTNNSDAFIHKIGPRSNQDFCNILELMQ